MNEMNAWVSDERLREQKNEFKKYGIKREDSKNLAAKRTGTIYI
jgi:hypothetical protein